MSSHAAPSPREVANQWFEEVWNRKNPKAIHQLMDSQAEGCSEAGTVKGPVQFEQLVFNSLTTAFPDIKVQIEGTVEEGENVVIRWRASATHSGPLGEIPASNRPVSFSGMTWLHIRNGKIQEGQDRYNLHSLLNYLSTGQPSATVTPA